MMFQNGRYAQVTAKNLKTSGKYGRIHSFDRMYVNLIMCDNGQSVRLLRHNVTVQKTVLVIQSETGSIGTIIGNIFTPNLTKISRGTGKSTYKPKFFEIGEYVRINHNSQTIVGRVVHIDGLEGRVTLDINGRLFTRMLTEILLSRASDTALLLKARLENVTKVNSVEPLDSKSNVAKAVSKIAADVSELYELTWMWNSTPCKRFYYSMSEMKTFIRESLDVNEITDLKYRVMVETKTVSVPVITKKIFDI